MTSATATEIEKRKGSVPITVGKKPLYITIDFIVMHVVMIEHLIVNRPFMEKIVRCIFLDGFHFFDSSTKDSLPEAHLGTADPASPFHGLPDPAFMRGRPVAESTPMWTREYSIASCYFNLMSFC